MLTRGQIEVLARKFGVGLAIQERDYLQHLFLYLLNKRGKDFVFKGGTCLKVIYNSPRYSEDLDFNCPLEKEIIRKTIEEIAEELSIFGINAFLKHAKFLKQGFTCDLSFQGALFNGRSMTKNKVRIDISMRKEKISAEQRVVNPQGLYPDLPRFIVTCLSLKDIFAEKVRALVIRGKPRDLWGVWFLLELYNLKFVPDKLKEKINILEKRWQQDLSPLLSPGQLVDFGQIKEKLFSFKKLFLPGNNLSL